MSDRTGQLVGDRSEQLGEYRSSEAQIRNLLDDQKEQILAECQARTSQHEFQAARAEEEQRLFQGQLLQQNLEFREADQRSLTEMEEFRKFQSSTFDTVARQAGQINNSERILPTYLPYWMINSGLIPGGQNSSKRQTVFFLLIDPRDESPKDLEKSDLSVPRRAQYLHNAWKRHQDAVYWVDINLAIWKGLTLSNSIECNHRSRKTSSFLYSKSC